MLAGGCTGLLVESRGSHGPVAGGMVTRGLAGTGGAGGKPSRNTGLRLMRGSGTGAPLWATANPHARQSSKGSDRTVIS